MCFASWFPPCRWDVFLIRKKYFSHRQGGNRKQGSNTHCGRQLPVYGGNLSASSKQGASKQPANKQQQAASKQPSSQQAASKQATASSQQAASQQQASSKPAASRQQASKKQAASKQQVSSRQAASKQQPSSKLPTTMCVTSLFHPCLWGKFFFLIIFPIGREGTGKQHTLF